MRFSFLTGVSKFSKVSLFSGLNNLQDITLDPRYSALCGYTDADLDTVFAPASGPRPRPGSATGTTATEGAGTVDSRRVILYARSFRKTRRSGELPRC